jgi:hypothetical protein
MMNFADLGKQVDRYWENFEAQMRDNPETVLLGAVATGFLLQVLPIRPLVMLILRVALFLLKPALIFWVGFKVYRWTQTQSREPKECERC